MTLALRARREVYRVYSEAEFFDGAASIGLCEPAVSLGPGERRLRRMAGVAALAGAVGAVGATFAVTGSRPARGVGRSAVADSHAIARTRGVTRTRSAVSRRVGEPAPPTRRAAAGLRRSRGERRGAREVGARRWPVEGARRYDVLAPSGASGPVVARPRARSVDAARPTVGRSADVSRARHAEFGFER